MFPAESFPAAYCEERAAADEVKRVARQQHQEAAKKTQAAASPQTQSTQLATPQNLTQAFLQRPPLTRPNSSGFLGNIFQGFVRAASASPSSSSSSSQSATPVTGDAKGAMGVNAMRLTAEMEKLKAEQNRDTDICAMPSW
ncbi:hypothetical protein LTR85_007138 [Meristemomyces frigidus]|nr:hypothetical protein LTR85_007138 [Meristemomyces frigidus]